MAGINVSKNGPYIVKDVTELTNSKGEKLEAKETMALCRCGGSGNKPFCDGTHTRINFQDDKN